MNLGIEPTADLFKKAIYESPSAVIIYNKDGQAVFINKLVAELTGYRLNNFPNIISWVKSSNPGAGDKKGQFKNDIYRLTTKTQQTISWECSFDAITDSKGKFIILRAQDITKLEVYQAKHKESEEKLEISELSFRRLVESNIIGIAIADFDGNFIESNDAFLKMVGYTRKDFNDCKVQWKKMTPKEYLEADYQHIEEAKVKGACTPFEKEYIRKDGSKVPVMLGFALIPGLRQSYVKFIIDLTEQKKAEDALKKSEANLKAIFNSSQQAFVLLDHDCKILAFNRLSADLDKQILDKDIKEGDFYYNYISKRNIKSFNENFHSALKGESVKVERQVTNLMGQEKWYEFNYAPVFNDKEVTGISISILDIDDRKKISNAIIESEKRFKALVQNSSDLITISDINGFIKYESPAVETILGYKPEELINRNGVEYIHPDDIPLLTENIEKVFATGEITPVEYRAKHTNGTWVYLESVVTNLLDDPTINGIVTNTRDITERKRSEGKLLETQHLIQRIVDATPNIVYLYDANENKNLYVNQAINSILGYSSKEMRNQSISFYDFLIHPEDIIKRQESRRTLNNAKKDEIIETEYRMKDSKNRWRWIYSRETVFSRNFDNSPKQILGTIEDVTKRKLMEEQLAKEAYYDSLTGLAKRKLFLEHLEGSMQRRKRDDNYFFAIAFLDIDRFKIINDSLGHSIGDKLLIAIAIRLKNCLKPYDTIARLGGDEFTVLLEAIHDKNELIKIVEKIQKNLSKPFKLKQYTVSVTSSIGIALGEGGYKNPEDMLRDADTAMYRAKNKGKNRFELFDSSMHTQMVKLLEMEANLRRALKRQEFVLYYQPVINLKTNKIVSCEALIRWNDPIKGIINPGEFLPIAEETGLIMEIDKWSLFAACQQNVQWQKMGLDPIQIAVNLSLRQLTEDQLLRNVIQITQETGLDPKYLELELTENVLIENTENTIEILKKLKGMGVKLLIDDFGTGYSSLTYLQRLPINGLKIDQSFVRNITQGQSSAITKTIISLAHNLDLKVIAEGVETNTQLDILKTQDCDEIQGYLYSRPVPADEFTKFMKYGIKAG